MVDSLTPLHIDSILGNRFASKIPPQFHEDYSHKISGRRISEVFYGRGTYKFYPRKREKTIISRNYIDDFYPLVTMKQYKFFHKHSFSSDMVGMDSELLKMDVESKIRISGTWKDFLPGYTHWKVFKIIQFTEKQLIQVGFRAVYHIFGIYGSRVIDIIFEASDYRKLVIQHTVKYGTPFYIGNHCTLNYRKGVNSPEIKKIRNYIKKYNQNIGKKARR